MAIRKIPLKERSPFDQSGSSNAGSDDRPDDPQVTSVVESIRKQVLKDRALFDKVGRSHPLSAVEISDGPCLNPAGSEGVRLVCPCILETRGVLYLPSEGPRPRGAREELRAPSPAPHARTQGRREERLGGCGRKCKPFALQLPHGAA